MSDASVCPMCGEVMRLRIRDAHDRIPGRQQVVTSNVREWFCPKCDYFEEEDSLQEPRLSGRRGG